MLNELLSAAAERGPGACPGIFSCRDTVVACPVTQCMGRGSPRQWLLAGRATRLQVAFLIFRLLNTQLA